MTTNVLGGIAYLIILLLICGIAFWFYLKWKGSKEISLKKRYYTDLKRLIQNYINIASELAVQFREIQNQRHRPESIERGMDKIDDLYQELKQFHILINRRLEQLRTISEEKILSLISDFLLKGPIEQLGVRELESFARNADQKKRVIFQLMDFDI